MILVSGAGGKTGRAVVRALARRGAAVRALVYRPEQAGALLELGAREAVAGDMRRAEIWQRVLPGAGALYHICPNMAPEEVAIGRTALDAARKAGTGHVVYHSVLHPQAEAMPHHWHKLRVEEQLFESGLPYTILQPAPYMQNVLGGWKAIAAEGRYRLPYALTARLSMVDLADVADVAALVLGERGHEGATYELSGPEALDGAEVAAILARGLERQVQAETVALDLWEQGARATGMDDYAVQTLISMFRYYERFGLEGNPNVLRWLLGRPPTSFAAFVQSVCDGREG